MTDDVRHLTCDVQPGWRVRQQTRDVVHVMQEAAGLGAHYMSVPSAASSKPCILCYHCVGNKSAAALLTLATIRFMEDDFELCGNGMLALQYAVAKAHSYQPDWTSIRFGCVVVMAMVMEMVMMMVMMMVMVMLMVMVMVKVMVIVIVIVMVIVIVIVIVMVMVGL